MKRVLLLILITICTLSFEVYAQTVSYTYKPLAAEGCTMRYSVSRQNDSYYIIATVKSDRLLFLNEPTIKIRTFNGEVLTFSGKAIGNGSSSVGVISGNLVLPVSEISSTAQFKVTEEQFEQIKNGVAKIRITMTPMNHERTFTKDKIGKKLYKFYIKQKEQEDSF
ncbi:MAG: hypothetical protein J5720_08465 [Bacteroidaceae bacterium]|nr:hypothetical protein [Bacteroidaceae bacterium]